jgi:hypothetical protein
MQIPFPIENPGPLAAPVSFEVSGDNANLQHMYNKELAKVSFAKSIVTINP